MRATNNVARRHKYREDPEPDPSPDDGPRCSRCGAETTWAADGFCDEPDLCGACAWAAEQDAAADRKADLHMEGYLPPGTGA